MDIEKRIGELEAGMKQLSANDETLDERIRQVALELGEKVEAKMEELKSQLGNLNEIGERLLRQKKSGGFKAWLSRL